MPNCCNGSAQFRLLIDRSHHCEHPHVRLTVISVWGAHLDFLAVDLHQPLPEVHPDRGLGFLGEFAGAEAVCEAGLPDPRVPDHDDFEDARPRRRKRRARQRAGQFSRRAALRHSKTDVRMCDQLGGGASFSCSGS